jgi:hypothetical protein
MINGEVFLALCRSLLNLNTRANAIVVGIIDFSVPTKIALERCIYYLTLRATQKITRLTTPASPPSPEVKKHTLERGRPAFTE